VGAKIRLVNLLVLAMRAYQALELGYASCRSTASSSPESGLLQCADEHGLLQSQEFREDS